MRILRTLWAMFAAFWMPADAMDRTKAKQIMEDLETKGYWINDN